MSVKEKSSIEAVLFDWDGTLLDSYDADSAAYLGVFREMSIPWGLDELTLHYAPNGHHIYRAAKLPRARLGGSYSGLAQELRLPQLQTCYRCAPRA
jgi:beta-phosphoglucomutase-like phosphatase (HAD superfamily)